MPTTCLNAKREVLISFDFSRDEWDALKSTYQQAGLIMKCCGAPAVPKTSRLGTQFFAHKNSECGEGHESLEHILCKQLVVKGARSAGWKALPEEAGKDIEGNKWISDVLCSKGQRKVAFEIQLANQTFSEYKRRTAVYHKSKVRCLWLVRRTESLAILGQMCRDKIESQGAVDPGRLPDRQDMPLFLVDVTDVGNIFVFFPWRLGCGPHQIPLDLFIHGCLSGQLSFRGGLWRWSLA